MHRTGRVFGKKIKAQFVFRSVVRQRNND